MNYRWTIIFATMLLTTINVDIKAANAQQVGHYQCIAPDGESYRARAPHKPSKCRFIIDQKATKLRVEASRPKIIYRCYVKEKGGWFVDYELPKGGEDCTRSMTNPKPDDGYCDPGTYECRDSQGRPLVVRLNKFMETCSSSANFAACTCIERALWGKVPDLTSREFTEDSFQKMLLRLNGTEANDLEKCMLASVK